MINLRNCTIICNGQLQRSHFSTEAFDAFQQAIKHLDKLEIPECLKCYDTAIAIDPENPHYEFQKSLVLLLNGNFKEGFELWERRFDAEPNCKFKKMEFQEITPWSGEDLNHKTILLYCEQGAGDLLLYLRFIAKLKMTFPLVNIIVEAPGSFTTLLEHVPCIDAITSFELSEYPQTDYVCSVFSLPFLLGTTAIPQTEIIRNIGHCTEAHCPEFRQNNKRKVGICWSGSNDNPHDYQRSIPFELFKPITDLDCDCYNLQQYQWGCRRLIDLSKYLKTFLDTARIISSLDVVVTVDTSIANLALTLGIPTIVALPYLPDYRWGLTESSWYPEAILYRQDSPDDWESVMQTIVEDLNTI